MDYSLLIGLHFRETSFTRDPAMSEARSSGVRTPIGNFLPLPKVTMHFLKPLYIL